MEDRPRILVVDDEARSVELLIRTLRPLGRVEGASSGDEAWAKARDARLDLVITDQRMPGMKGSELLARIAEKDAHTGRILLTGYADLHAIADAINRGRIHAYVSKPWAPEQILLTARSLVERVRLERQNEHLLGDLVARNEELEAAMRQIRTAQQRIVDAERLGAIGRMVAMIVHDFRSPLTVIRSSAAELARDAARLPAEEVRNLSEAALKEAERMARMCSELLAVTRASEGTAAPEPEALDALVEETLAAVAEEAGRAGVRLETGLASGAVVRVDAERLRRALLNLTYNAIEAMPEGGTLRVETLREGDAAVLRVADTGVGIPEAIRERLFEPFVTAGKEGGSGLGLAVVRKVVEDQGGSIAVAKAEGGGTVFEIRLPHTSP